MPIYEFHCGKCEKDSEILVRSPELKGLECPHCGSKKLVKKLSVFASAGGGDRSSAGPACDTPGSGSCGCCGGGKHRH